MCYERCRLGETRCPQLDALRVSRRTFPGKTSLMLLSLRLVAMCKVTGRLEFCRSHWSILLSRTRNESPISRSRSKLKWSHPHCRLIRIYRKGQTLRHDAYASILISHVYLCDISRMQCESSFLRVKTVFLYTVTVLHPTTMQIACMFFDPQRQRSSMGFLLG